MGIKKGVYDRQMKGRKEWKVGKRRMMGSIKGYRGKDAREEERRRRRGWTKLRGRERNKIKAMKRRKQAKGEQVRKLRKHGWIEESKGGKTRDEKK